MGAISNDPAKLAYLTGFCEPSSLRGLASMFLTFSIADKSLQSAGAAGIWRADGVGVP